MTLKYFCRFNIIAIIFILSLSSCKKYLTKVPTDALSDQTLWNNKDNVDLFLNGVYSRVPGSFGTDDPIENYSDNSMASGGNLYSRQVYGQAEYTADNSPTFSASWSTLYSAIRSCNVFIKNLGSTGEINDAGWKAKRLAEARFLRAYFYQLLWLQYGGVPIIEDVLNVSEQGDEIFRPRNTDEETVKFITDECAAIVDDLPLKAEVGGRAARGSALALKGWCELYNASPLKNANNDKGRWQVAATTFKKIIDMKVYSLFPEYNDMFMEGNNNNNEVIFAKQYLGNTSLGGSREGLQGPWHAGPLDVSWNGVNPTQELVDSYMMANGLPISDPASGYNPQDPYSNREKRFYESIVYDGSTWLGYQMAIKQGVGSDVATDISGSRGGTKSGYYLRKGLNPKYAIKGPNQQNSANEILFRYGEILLCYAEAQNEAVGPDESVYDAINKVRNRVDLPSLKDGLTQDEMREAIYRERRVELAFENKRLYDLLRWKKAFEKLNTHLHGIIIEKVNDSWNYRVFEAAFGERHFKERNYLLPIPTSARELNKQLTQNPNY